MDKNDIALRAKEIRERFIRDGFIRTNFGWVMPAWIDYGYKIGALAKFPLKSPDGSFTYSLLGVKKMKEGKERMDMTSACTLFDYIEMQRGKMTPEQFNSRKIDREMK